MAALDFPASPTNGQKHPVSPAAGQIQYTYDGEKWTTSGSFGLDQATADARYVNVAGDSMVGTLNVDVGVSGSYSYKLTGNSPAHVYGLAVATGSGNFTLDDVTAGAPRLIINTAGAATFMSTVQAGASGTTGTYYFGSTGTKYLNYDGSSFNLLGGNLSVGAGPASYASLTAGNISAIATATTGAYYFGSPGSKYLSYDGSNFNLTGGPLYTSSSIVAGSNIMSALTANTGGFYFGSTGAGQINYSSGSFNFTGGPIVVPGVTANRTDGGYAHTLARAGYRTYGMHVDTNGSFNIDDITAADNMLQLTYTGVLKIRSGYCTRAGNVGPFGGNTFNITFNAGLAALWIDSTNLGNITTTSDYRIKKDVIDLPGMWDTVKALRPIKYTQAQFSPPSHVKHVAEQALLARKEAEENPDAKPGEVNTGPLFAADDIERWGFIAHELQGTLPSMASGDKDSPDTVQSLNLAPVVAALTKALQEAMTRIEALEAAP